MLINLDTSNTLFAKASKFCSSINIVFIVKFLYIKHYLVIIKSLFSILLTSI